ncbi:hypothetical protein PV328_007719 [Microctonus aethiopoides]|uniref:Uncharacterized protein n=1 Tax=Microctonus aethiopoides TaxID=144406 RepID=A0AA39F0T3_9HYME|nr:hypothetical protein PV328_007719 [Microctonus aethiopoides]
MEVMFSTNNPVQPVKGSANGIIDGKHFNRCKRIHPLLSGALQVLHFNQFFSTYNADNDILIEGLQYFEDNPSQETEYFELRPSLQVVVNDYDAYCKATLSGDHGKTAQFFMQGAFGVKRTSANFSRSPVDLTLEQTINADAANRLTGILVISQIQYLLGKDGQ